MEEGATSMEKLSYLKLSSADCSLAWVLAGQKARGSSIKRARISLADIVEHAVQAQVKDALTRDEMEKMILFRPKEEELYAQVEQKLSWEYSWDLYF